MLFNFTIAVMISVHFGFHPLIAIALILVGLYSGAED